MASGYYCLCSPRLAAICLLAPALMAQTNATVQGVVRDTSGAAVPAAALTLSNTEQRRPWSTESNMAGAYTFQQIPPGNYVLEVEAPDFKKYARTGLRIEVAQTAELDVTLELGAVSETVEVRAETPLLDTAGATLGEVVNSIAAVNLPLNGRDVLQLVALAPGVNVAPKYRTATTGSGDVFAVAFSANGGRSLSNTILLDGSPQEVTGYSPPVYVPPPDAIQEFRVQTNSLSAEYGRTGGAVVNMTHRSGTSEFHGALWEFLRNDVLDAAGFFNNRNETPKPALRYNQFGATLGGPLTPSRRTAFFFLSYEGNRQVSPEPATFTVPTAKLKTGDFSEAGAVIYDPLTINGAGARQPFPANRIDPSRINAAALRLLSFYPEPNRPGVVNNYFSQAASRTASNDVSVKIDRRVSARQNLFGRFSWINLDTLSADQFRGPASPGQGMTGTHDRSVTLDDNYSLRGWILHGNYGYGYYAIPMFPLQSDLSPSSLGLAAYLDPAVQFDIFPRVQVDGYAAMGADMWSVRQNKFETHTLTGDAARLFGNHTVKAGGSYRVNRVSSLRAAYPAGYYAFNEVWTRADIAKAGGGNSLASMLLGVLSAGEIRQEPSLASQTKYGALYLQDDWRAHSRLTLNLGLRWEANWPLTERFDRASWFDLNARLPLQVPGMGPLYGGLVFAGSRTPGAPRGFKNLDWANFSPRVGLAWRADSRSVVRAGFGLFFNPPVFFGDSQALGALGFNASTAINTSIDGGRTPYATLSNPYPDGLNVPENGANGLLTFVGQTIPANFRGDRSGYSPQWNLDVQRELAGGLLVDAAYAGGAGVKLPASSNMNQLADSYLQLGDALNKKIANPFFGVLPASTTLGKQTTTYGQVLRPFPWLTGLTQQWGSQAHSTYHALQAKLRKRYSAGFQFLLAYTWSKSIDDASAISPFLGQQNPGYTNANRKDLDKSLSAADVPHRLVFNSQWELPFGRGRRWLPGGWRERLAGGWSLNVIGTLQSGMPISINSATNTTNSFGGEQRPNSAGISSRTPGGDGGRIDGWFNPAAFTDARPYAFGNIGRFLPGNRGPSLHNWDISALKDIALRERARLEFRAEFFNAFNHVNFQPPAATFGRPQFGLVTGAEPARIIQAALKLYY